MTETTWQSQETEKWREELISLRDQNTNWKSRECVLTVRGVLMSLKMFLSITPIHRLPKTLQSTSCLSRIPGNSADKGTARSTQSSGASYWVSKRRETASISSATAELCHFCVAMTDIWLLEVDCDEWNIGYRWVHAWSVMDSPTS